MNQINIRFVVNIKEIFERHGNTFTLSSFFFPIFSLYFPISILFSKIVYYYLHSGMQLDFKSIFSIFGTMMFDECLVTFMSIIFNSTAVAGIWVQNICHHNFSAGTGSRPFSVPKKDIYDVEYCKKYLNFFSDSKFIILVYPTYEHVLPHFFFDIKQLQLVVNDIQKIF